MPEVLTSLATLRHALESKRVSAEELARECFRRIAASDAGYRAIAALDDRRAIEHARRLDRERAAGVLRGPLHGVPIVVKDLIDVAGSPTRAGSRLTSEAPAARSATLVNRLRAAGLVLLGKTATVEFAFGGWGTNQVIGTPRNPWSPAGVHLAPGGSSSGSAVALAAGYAPLAIGTDTGGSVRIPASLCGVSALKPSSRAVPRSGIIPLSSTLDSIGPMSLFAADLLPLFDVMRGACVRLSIENKPPSAWRVGIFADSALGILSQGVAAGYARAVDQLAKLGATVCTVAAPTWETVVEDTGIIIGGEAWRTHRATVEFRLGAMDTAVAARFAAGRNVSDSDLTIARRRRRQQVVQFRPVFDDIDFLLTPTTPIGPIPLAEIEEGKLPLSRFTRAANYFDLAAVAIPAGLDAQGLPTSLQLMAPYGAEDRLLAIAAVWQNLEGWQPRLPAGVRGFDI